MSARHGQLRARWGRSVGREARALALTGFALLLVEASRQQRVDVLQLLRQHHVDPRHQGSGGAVHSLLLGRVRALHRVQERGVPAGRRKASAKPASAG